MQSDKNGFVSKTTTNGVGASYQFQSWLRSNNYHIQKDVSGNTWQLRIDAKLGPHPNDTHKGIWSIKVEVKAALGVNELLEAKVLDEQKDSRLVQLLGEGKIPMELKRPDLRSETAEAARGLIADEVEKIKKLLKSSRLNEIKRTLVGQWVDRQMSFSSKV